jgi:ligand-binding sensor domain-containing protein
LARQVSNRGALVALTVVLATLAVGAGYASPGAVEDPARAALAAAEGAVLRGDATGARAALRQLRSDFPDSPAAMDSFALDVKLSLADGDDYRARYFLQRLLDGAPRSAAAFSASLMVAGHCYTDRAWLAALEYYGNAAACYEAGAPGKRSDYDIALLRAAELSLYHDSNPDAARTFFRKIQPQNLSGKEAGLFQEMRVRLLWSAITPSVLGLNDANVSSLLVDGDDLWVGTWNGGTSRFSVSSGRADPFPYPAFTRSIAVSDRRVWVGTAEGLSWYGKGSGRWGAEDDFQGPSPRKVQVVKEAAGILYAGTLGDGLFRRGSAGWDQVSDGDLPGRFITCIAPDPAGGRLFIGTMNVGLVILDLATGAMSTLSESFDDFTTENVTTILPDAEGRVWIGTYGEGLSLWRPSKKSLEHFTKASGQIADDWILASCETDHALYFGSFGGGVSILTKQNGHWLRFGIAEGLPSLDIAAIAWRPPYVFFGTLGAGVSVYDEAADAEQP